MREVGRLDPAAIAQGRREAWPDVRDDDELADALQTLVALPGSFMGPGGEQVTELNGSGGWVHTNIWAAGKLDATYAVNGLHFHLSDPLGTRPSFNKTSGARPKGF